jgi:hypothetical protein
VRRLVQRLISTTASVYAACAFSFLAALFFIFIWTPLPFGWQGIDAYYDVAKTLAEGEPFEPFHIVWGYAYFLAFWYWVAGNALWVPLVAQAALNATVPFMIYRLVCLELGHRYGVMTAILTGLFSFNTVYASTQASDSVCTVVFVAMMWVFALGRKSQRPLLFAISGLLASLAFQFRPNLVLIPIFLAAVYLWGQPRRSTAKLMHLAVFMVAFAAGASPWIIRNYRLTQLFIPASTHGGVQLWFGSLQTGHYQSNWLYNPRAAFEHPPLDYSSIDELPVVVSGKCYCGAPADTRVEVIYWTVGNPVVRKVPAAIDPGGRFEVPLPDVTAGDEMSYYVEATVRRAGGQTRHVAPASGAKDPGIFVLSREHLSDLDTGNLVLDVFDLARIAAFASWGEGAPNLAIADLDGDGKVSDTDLTRGVDILANAHLRMDSPAVVAGIDRDAASTTVVLTDGSTLSIPRRFATLITDIDAQGPIAQSLVSRSQTFASIHDGSLPGRQTAGDISDGCLERVGVNSVPYRRFPHEMRRFTALSRDNISRDPIGYAWSTVVRAGRLFVIQGSDDGRTAIQFDNSRLIYFAGQSISLAYALIFAAGVVVAIRRRQVRALLALPIIYVPSTISFMLINARYAMTMQPFMFAFMAILLVAWLDRWSPPSLAPVREWQSGESG